MARNYNLMWAVYAIISLQAGSFFTLLETIRGEAVTWTSVSFFILFMICFMIFILDKGERK